MISDFLSQSYVLAQTRAQRDWLKDLLKKAKNKDPSALAAMKKHSVSLEQIETVIAALNATLKSAKKLNDGEDTAFIPSDPVLCAFQAGMTRIANQHANTVAAPLAKTRTTRSTSSKSKIATPAVIDTSATERLKHRSNAGTAIGAGGSVLKAPFVEGDDIHYGLDGFGAKFGALFTGRHEFNKNPARVAISPKPLRLFIFGDWGTGLPLAQRVTEQIRSQLDVADGTRQQHVVHLGDVYYVGEAR